jgi:microcystin-dependent protein
MSSPYLAELRIISWNYPPRGWAFCNGQTLSIQQNAALFSLLGTTYGGDGQTTFALPNLQGRMPVHFGNGINLGQNGGETTHILSISEMPAHSHVITGDGTGSGTASDTPNPSGGKVLGQSAGRSGTPAVAFPANIYNSSGPTPSSSLNQGCVAANGASQPHENMSPYLVLNIVIALQGIFPSRN